MTFKIPYLLLVLCNLCFIIKTKCEINDLFVWAKTACLTNEYFDTNTFKCIACQTNQLLVPSHDKMTCICNNRSIIAGWKKDGWPLCKPCSDEEMPTMDKRNCILYQKSVNYNITFSSCDENSIRIERSINGSLLRELTCVQCALGMIPNQKKEKCIICPISMPNCTCSQETHDYLPGIGCYEKNIISSLPNKNDIYEITYNSGKMYSKLLYGKLIHAIYKCKMNETVHCQSVSNMCVLNLYQDSHGGPCRLYKDIQKVNNFGLPWIYYPEGDAWNILSKKTINKRFTLDSTSEESYLNVMVNKWYLNGSWIGQELGLKSLIQCPLQVFPEKIRFGSEYSIRCYVTAKELFGKKEPFFYDIYLKYDSNNQTLLHSIPLLIENYKQHKKFVNKVNDISQWQLTRRLFNVDAVSSYKLGDNMSSVPYIIRYLKSASLRVRVRDGVEEGMIYTPLLFLSYGEITKDEIEKNVNIKVSLNIFFQKNDNIKQSFDMALAILCSFSGVWSIIKAWSYTRRAGQRAIDLVAVLHLCIIACGHLANVFFFISTCAAIHNFVYYKWQIIAHVLLPSAKLTYLVRTYIIVSFPLKVVEVLFMIWYHLNIDIFLIDWEQPRIEKQQTFSVSAWRTYFVSNKWIEIQTERRTNVILQLAFTVLCLKILICMCYFVLAQVLLLQVVTTNSYQFIVILIICLNYLFLITLTYSNIGLFTYFSSWMAKRLNCVWGIENWAVCIPDLQTRANPFSDSYVKFNKIHRLAIGVAVFCIIYIIQCAFIYGVYERYIKNPIQEFVDICSLANISVFILSLENFGFYIHGRSVHGFSDTDMATLKRQLRREEEDLVGHRGLLPASDHQTFKMLIPPKLRLVYRSLLSPNVPNFQISGFNQENKSQLSNMDHGMQSYVTINRFLAAFIEHALKDLDYEVREKSFIEALLDIELCDMKKNGTLYNDNGHSFDSVLYYGNEITLFTFNLVIFSFVEILSQDFLLAAVITVFCDEVLARIRRYGGRKNFSKKTLIDEHFLL